MNLKRRIPALAMAAGLALAGAACEAETGVEDPAVTDPVGDPAGGDGLDDGGTGDDLGGTEGGDDLGG